MLHKKEYICSLSYGKDSIVIPEICRIHNLPLDRIVHVEIMATPTVHSDLPPMLAFKSKADRIIKERYGITVEHICAPLSYEEYFYKIFQKGKKKGHIYGFPMVRGGWCNSRLKLSVLNQFNKSDFIQYLGICSDEPDRANRLDGSNKIALPFKFGYTESDCLKLAQELDLLSPIYSNSQRGGCWFCHNQGVEQLRFLRANYPEYWKLLLKWDLDSPVSFKPDGHSVHDFDKRFSLEDEKLLDSQEPFRWQMLNNTFKQINFFELFI